LKKRMLKKRMNPRSTLTRPMLRKERG